MRRLALACLLATPTCAFAAPTLNMPPDAARTVEDSTVLGSYAMPVGAWAAGGMKTVPAEGDVTSTAWRIRDQAPNTLAVMKDLRDQLVAEGFSVVFDCDTDACGGFDFRFAIPVLPEPDMHVDLGDFRFLSATRGETPRTDYVALLVSRSSDSAYVQMTRVGPTLETAAPLARAETEPSPPAGTLGDSLLERGKVVLADLSFASGTTNLSPGDYASLDDLAAYLVANPDQTVALVGHTDAEGGLAANVALSKKRAQSVRDYMVGNLGCNPAQLSADGVGYLSPVASNLTEEGRNKNRRVEALLTSTR